ncbi:MAG: Fic family protein [Candidatus Competibacteraceae bacterium]|nr:Fic family protein [Candidatus Competibacteraceae bacterium]
MNLLSESETRIETRRFGPFAFRLGVDGTALAPLYRRVLDAHERFNASPLSQVARQLEREVVASSIFGTNSIEGGALTEEETQQVLELDPAQVREEEQLRAVNLKAAYDVAQRAATTPGWRLDVPFIQKVHAAITQRLTHPRNQPGVFRDNPKAIKTHVGDQAHGGRYQPPQHGHDIETLMQALASWHQELAARQIPALIRAPLVHYYHELIHPFWDGNGRVGRVLEAALLQADGFQYAPFALARYYLTHIDEYFTLFNRCRRDAKRNVAHPHTSFVQFHLEGMRVSINDLHDRVNQIVKLLLFQTQVRDLYDEKRLNARQYTIISQLLATGEPVPLAEIRRAPWYQSLYLKLTDKTRQRDLHRLRELGLVTVDQRERLWPGFVSVQSVPDD